MTQHVDARTMLKGTAPALAVMALAVSAWLVSCEIAPSQPPDRTLPNTTATAGPAGPPPTTPDALGGGLTLPAASTTGSTRAGLPVLTAPGPTTEPLPATVPPKG